MNIKKVIVFLLLCGAGAVKAQSYRPVQSPFEKLASEFAAACEDQVCTPPFAEKKAEPLGAAFKLKLFRIAKAQAQVWGDTILEGDYFAEGDTRLDSVTRLFKNGEPVGYLITYSETAWDTSNCMYDENDPSSLYTCMPGRIVESSYVSPDLKEYFYDDETAAVFRENE